MIGTYVAEDYSNLKGGISDHQRAEVFDRNMRRWVEKMNKRTDGEYGEWSYTDGVLADGEGRHYVKRAGGWLLNQDGETMRLSDVDFPKLKNDIWNGDFFGWGLKAVFIPPKDKTKDDLVCFGLHGEVD